MSLICMQSIGKVYRTGSLDVRALTEIDLTIEAGEFLAIMGPSGSGKSTLMNLIGCLDAPSTGTYFLDGEDVSRLSRDQMARVRNTKIGFVCQGFNLLPRFDAVANVELPLIYARLKSETRHEAASKALDQVGLSDRAHHLPSQLSGGQQQRVAIARALANNPEIILADEPTGNLDSSTSEDIMTVFRQLNREHQITIVLVTHDPEVSECADRKITLRDGKILGDERKVGVGMKTC